MYEEDATQDNEQAIKWWTKLAEQGYVKPQYRLSVIFQAKQDNEQSLKWLTQAASNCHPLSQFLLGEKYRQGTGGVKQDDKQAVKWLTRATKTPMCGAIGKSIFRTTGFGERGNFADLLRRNPANPYKNKKPYPKDAKPYTTDSYWFLGMGGHLQLRLGRGEEQDKKELFRFDRALARSGVQGGEYQYRLGFAYGLGEGVTQDEASALWWFRKTANQGDGRSCVILSNSCSMRGIMNCEPYPALHRLARQSLAEVQEALDKTALESN